jgi:hypothetical protein
MRDLLAPRRIEVGVDPANPTLVVLHLGNVEAKFDYATAIQLSTWLRFRGKQAKLNAGDDSRHWSVIGNLVGVINGERPWQK